MKNIDLGFARSYIDIYDTTDDYEHYRVEEAGLNDVLRNFQKTINLSKF